IRNSFNIFCAGKSIFSNFVQRNVINFFTHLRQKFCSECVNAPAGQVYFAAENPKGELGFFLDSKGGGIANRLKMRSPSFCSLSILPELVPGHLVSDIPAILGSFDFVQGECDR
ncbi:MAG: hypothetical protein II349_06310, partial [Akkermansia sp.]|nr:hypothetical protein [Akkermansia sp.]